MAQNSLNAPGTATSAHPDLRYYRAERPTRPTDPQPSIVPLDIEVWQRAAERLARRGDVVPLDEVLDQLDQE